MMMILETCPHCGADNEFEWNVKTMGYKAHCLVCGEPLLLCDECIHADDGLNAECRGCDWHETEDGKSCCFRCKGQEVQA